MIVLAVLIGSLSSIILIYKLKNARRTQLVNKIPGPPANFIFGNVLPFLLAKREGKNLYRNVLLSVLIAISLYTIKIVSLIFLLKLCNVV